MRGVGAGALVVFGIFALVAGSLAALFQAAGGAGGLPTIGPYVARVLGFSLLKAALSTLLSLRLGMSLALALARRRVPGRHPVIAARGAAAGRPTIGV